MSLSSIADGLPRVAILGGGQLGQMLTLKAIELGLEVTIFERTAGSPAARIASHEVVGSWDDRVAHAELLSYADVVTLENEFVDAAVLQTLRASGAEVFPSPETLARIQDKLVQKQTLAAAQLPVPHYARVDAPPDLLRLGRELGWPMVLKARRGGYDGKGNALVERAEDAEAAFRSLDWPAKSLMAEQHVPFRSELAVMVVRGRDGQMLSYPVVDTVQRNHVCHTVVAPARVSATARSAATNVACAAVEAFDGVGVFGVELFLLHGDGVLVNELAPRPHNSGHYTIEACETSQFENHLRAVLGWPLGSPFLIYPGAAMVNLLGSGAGAVTGLRAALAVPGAHAHLYGKRPSVHGRKMGHVTALGDSGDDALRRAQAAADALEV